MNPVVGVPGEDFSVEDVQGTFPEKLEITPLDRPPEASISVPGSKSVTNRALLLAALADGRSSITNPLFSDDSYWLMDALVRLGIGLTADREGGEVRVEGLGGKIPASDVNLFVGNAGTVARFLPPALALGPGPYTVDGAPRMRERPISDLVEGMRQLGAAVDYTGETERYPLRVRGGGIMGGTARIPGARSSQFASGLLMAAPYAETPVTLRVDGRKQWPYIGITVALMRSFGVDVTRAPDLFSVRPATYKPLDYGVEPDASAASYFLAAAAITGGSVEIPGLGSTSTQGDLRFAEVLQQMGCDLHITPDSIRIHGPDRLKGVDVDMNAFSDTMMTLAAIAPFASGPTTIRNVAHSRLQETDRISAVATELHRLGVPTQQTPSSIRIIPQIPRPAEVQTYGDHRMAMAFAVTGLVVSGISIRDPGCVTKTFPDFFGRLGELR
jgi:3-phosphoshikimate 1-carboxyvinyltransferase